MSLFRVIAFLFLFSVIFGASVPLQDDDVEEEITTHQQHQDTTVYIEHALEPGVFTHRGAITLGGIRGESAKFTQNSLSPGELAQLNALIKSGKSYQIRAKSSGSSSWITTHTKACYMQSSGLEDSLRLHINNKGQVFGLTYTPTISDTSCGTGSLSKTKFRTTTSVDFGQEAPKPGAEAPPKTEAEKKVDQQQNQSFFNEVVLNGLTGLGGAPAEGEGGAAGGAAGGARAPAARGAAPRR